MGLPPSEAIKVACPICGAKPGKRCVRVDVPDGAKRPIRLQLHQQRVQAAGRKRTRA